MVGTRSTSISSLCHLCLRKDNTRKFLSFFCLSILALSMLGNAVYIKINCRWLNTYTYFTGNYCAGLVVPRRSLRIPTVDRFSFIQPKDFNSILYKNVLWANPRNIDIGFGTSNVFANVSMTFFSNSEPI